MKHIHPITPLLADPTSPAVVDDLLDPKAAAAFLGLAVLTLADFRVKGGGPVFAKAGRLVRYRKTDLDAWIDSRSYTSTSEYRKGI